MRSRGDAGAAGEVGAGLSPRFVDLLLAEPLAGSTVLDVGTGAGRLGLWLGPRCRRVIGIDRDPAAIAEARGRAVAAGLTNVDFVVADAEAGEYASYHPDVVAAHLCMSDAIVARAGRALAPGRVLAFVALHAEQWIETGRRSRFAYDEQEMRALLGGAGFRVEQLEVEREVRTFRAAADALAAVAGLEARWRRDGRWLRYVEFVAQGGRTLTQSRLLVKARRS